MNISHYLSLLAILLVGSYLRIANLSFKPLWMDEVITAIFSLGKNYQDLPLDWVISIPQLAEIFTYQPSTCAQISENLIHQSTHPPLFFCAMHGWMGWLNRMGVDNWIWGLRSLPVVFGVVAIAAVYFLGRVTYSPRTGLVAALVMAVSPFAVYLSQEARHYTLPILIIIFALIAQIKIQREILSTGRVRWLSWLGWVGVNSLGLYIHYFFILVIIAEVLTLIGFFWWFIRCFCQGRELATKRFIYLLINLFISIFFLSLTYLPWLRILLTHSRASETDWLPAPEHVAPIYQTLLNWVLMIIALPVEHQPLIIAIPSAIFMVVFSLWFGAFFIKQLKILTRQPQTQVITSTLIVFTLCLISEIFALAYLFHKDITAVPRYSFIWYPSTCLLIAAVLNYSDYKLKPNHFNSTLKKSRKSNQLYIIALVCVGIISSFSVNHNLVFQKPFLPEKIAQTLNQEGQKTKLIVMAYRNYQDMALGLSFALAIPKSNPQQNINNYQFALLEQAENFTLFWQQLAQQPTLSIPNLNLWVFAPARKRHDYPELITKSPTNQHLCQRDRHQHYRIGIPYQLYRCGQLKNQGRKKSLDNELK